VSYGFDDQTEAWVAERLKELPHEELAKIAKDVEGFGAGLICPNPKCALTNGRIVCTPVAMEGFPIRYAFTCMECLFGTYPSATPEAAREVFLTSSRTTPWNDNKGMRPT
jgi:hypothetical protein